MKIWDDLTRHLPVTRNSLEQLEKRIIMSQEEMLERIKAMQTKSEKIATETRGLIEKINGLLRQIRDGQAPISENLEAAIGELEHQLGVVDEMVPDAPAPE